VCCTTRMWYIHIQKCILVNMTHTIDASSSLALGY
jgi:hypothetical protein